MSHQGQQQNKQPNPGAPPEFLFPMNPNKAFNFNLASAFMGNQFNLQSNSIFAYQEFDQFSSFVGNSKITNSFESNNNQIPQFEHLGLFLIRSAPLNGLNPFSHTCRKSSFKTLP